MKKLFIILYIVISAACVNFAQSGNYDSLVTTGIRQIYGIKFHRAEKTFRSLIKEYPDKPAGKFFIAMIDWWKIMLDQDNESYDDEFLEKLDSVVDQCDNILDKDPDNVDAIFFKGGAIGFRGRLHAFRESWLKAADAGREALPLVQKAAKLDPKNVDVKLGFGIYNYYAAVLPEQNPILKPVMFFLPSGNKKQGIEDLEYVSKDGKYAKYEARYFLMDIFYHYENNPFEAQKYANLLTKDFPDNPNFERWLGRIYAKEGKTDSAAFVFKDVLRKANQKLTGYTFKGVSREAAYYVAYRYRLSGNLDSAKIYFQKCADLSKQIDKEKESGFLINSYLYLGMINDAQNKREKAVWYYKKLLDMPEFGKSKDLAEQYLKKPYGK